MKREAVLFGVIFVFLMMFSVNISAELNTTQISKAYSCLENKTADCSTSLDDNIFTLLSVRSCRDNVLQASSNEECWPSGSCNIKQTSQALLALKESGSSTSKPKAWLLAHTRTPTNLDWFLQIESNEATSCSITYSGSTYQFSIGEDKKIDRSAGSCLSLAQDDYWFEVASQCQGNEYQITCDKDFKTGTLFKEQSSDTVYIAGKEANSASSGGTTKEQINSSCFADGNSCSYEGTLWASLVLKSMNEEISPYIPYLVTMAESNPRVLPEAFLYILVGDDYTNALLSKQKSSQYWETSGDRYYDTAVALLALRSDTSNEKSNALDWLGTTQGTDGCWQGSIKNTAFILYSISPRASSSGNGSTTKPDCETVGSGFCMSSSSCSSAGGTILDAYQCSSGFFSCCSVQKKVLTCAEQGGDICSSSERCVGGRTAEASDSFSCCVEGSCVPSEDVEENTCQINFGTCKSFECGSGEKADSSLSCDSVSEVCCIQKTTSYLWIWILAILIVFVTFAIVFRDKLRRFWIYIQTKFKPSGPSGGTSHSPSYFSAPVRRMIPRRILPPSSHHTQHKPAPSRRHSGELDDVLKKLKDMSK